jgi:hypothetical protein
MPKKCHSKNAIPSTTSPPYVENVIELSFRPPNFPGAYKPRGLRFEKRAGFSRAHNFFGIGLMRNSS